MSENELAILKKLLWDKDDELARLRAELADLLEVHKPLLADCLALRAENERLRAALAEQVAECDMPGCTLCHEHRQLLRQVAG